MRSLPDSEMTKLDPTYGVGSDQNADEKKLRERKLEEDEGAAYYV